MKRLIIGIIAVFCFQVALIGNTWLNAKFDPVAEQPSTTELALVDESVPDFFPAQATAARVHVTYAARRRPAAPVTPNRAVRRLETTTASFRETTPPVRPTHLAVPDVKMNEARPRIEKRSLFAKAWPVIKKPYSWIRVLASKFD